jgi:hypothetical protein
MRAWLAENHSDGHRKKNMRVCGTRHKKTCGYAGVTRHDPVTSRPVKSAAVGTSRENLAYPCVLRTNMYAQCRPGGNRLVYELNMAKRLTIFYSWQSDTPSNLNRSFIEKALHEALNRLHSDATLESALRDSNLELDKDTKGVAGSPAIADTIFNKIDECVAFIADLTFVGKSMDGLTTKSKEARLFPNPNVLIEYGYARKRHGTSALVGIMNTAYGVPDDLPFDLRHLRRPITYHLADSANTGKQVEHKMLAKTLVDALRLILTNHPSPPSISVAEFIPQKATENPSAFWGEFDMLIAERSRLGERTVAPAVPDEGRAYLRLYPAAAVSPLETEFDAELLVRDGGVLRPMGQVGGWSPSRNAFGGIIYEPPHDGKLYHFTQLLLSREIWGVDARCLHRSELHKLTQGKFDGFIPGNAVEEVFVDALQSYLNFAKSVLKLPLPLRVEAGLVGIKGYPIAVGETVRGECFSDHVFWQGNVDSYEAPPYEILAAFFDLMYKKCGRLRPESRQVALAQQFGS